MSAASSAHVVVIGGGVAGLASAVSLKRAGIASTVLEKSDRSLAGLRRSTPR
jgi:phytoene dehydrogenase-like protein